MNKSVFTRYAITLLIASAISYYFYFSRVTSIASSKDLYLVLCDAFTIPGVILVCFGCLVMISNTGQFSGIAYGFKYAISRLIPGKGKVQDNYYNYLQDRKDKKLTGYSFLFVVGCGFVALAILFMILFYKTHA